ncbi:M6 family metalloprotease domain-containing protein [bacterium]|nr:M6 family metalloprotease domain-containing protein [bacterium]
MNRHLWWISVLVISGWATAALAVVMPEEEWFDSPDKYELWQEMWPVLNDWEFNTQEALTGPPKASLAGIREHLGRADNEVAQELGLAADAPDVYRYDLNFDGRVDQFDVLELGYEVRPPQKQASLAPSHGTNKWIVLRADFSDQSANYTTYDIDYFEERFFDEDATKPSVNDYYQEVSYGALSIAGTVWGGGSYGDGWHKGAHTKSWYINNGGNYLVAEAVAAADATVDFSDFDVDGDGYVDTCICFYPNQVYSGGLWPHRSSGLNIHVDGVIVDSYFLTGYDTGDDSKTMVISVHEYGHILGLPDLYDIDYSSNGVGKWSLMSNNYDTSQLVPSPDPWCKIALGWVEPVVITDDVTGYSLGCFQDGPNVLKIWTNGLEGDQYFLVSNYRKKKTDANRPGEGLLVWHIDDSRGGGNQDNKNENRKHVDVESARGYNNPADTNPKDPLDAKQDYGHANDPFFSGNSDSSYTGVFDDDANPFARDYPNPGEDTYIKLSNFSTVGDTMTLDIQVVTATAPTCAITSHADDDAVSATITVTVDATATGARTIDHVEFYLNGAYYGADSSSPYSLEIDTRPIYDGTGRELKAVAVDSAGEIDTDTVSIDVSNAATALAWSDDFESGIGAWAAYDFMGDQAWASKDIAATGVKSAGVGGSSGYDYDENDWLVSRKFDLTGTTHPLIRWRQRYRVASGENTCLVLVTDDDGATFDQLESMTGTNLEWHPMAVDLVDYVGAEVQVVFNLNGSSLNNITSEGGWWIDDFEIHEQSSTPAVLSITPGDGSVLSGVETITVTASDDEGVLAVEFLVDGTDLVHVDYAAPFSYDWNSDWVFNGSHSFKAVAYDADLQSADLTVGWTTSNSGSSLPFSEYFNADPGTAWRVIKAGGAGEWHWLATAGYGSSGGMRFAIPGDDAYDNNDNDWLISPTVNITGTDPGLGFLHKYDIEPPPYDFGRVYITTDLTNWTELEYFSGYNQTTWRAHGERLDSYVSTPVKLAFFFESDGGLTVDGWWVDEVEVTAAPQISGVVPTTVLPGAALTISGSGFGDGSAHDFPTVLINNVAATTGSWSDTSITVTVPDTSSGDVVVVRHGIASDGYAITVRPLAPVIDDLEQL